MFRIKMTATQRVLIGMLKENTGRSMLDSGDYYGRHYQANQNENFLAQPVATFRVESGTYKHAAEFSATINVFPWLCDRLHYDAKLTRAFNRFAAKPKNKDSRWLGLMEDFAVKRHGTGLYGDGSPMTINTYNSEDALSQTLQYVYWEEGDSNYVLLQVHGGCDVRGGYTAPKVFEVTGESTALFDNARMSICEEVPEHIRNQPALPGMPQDIYEAYWDTDDAGYTWHPSEQGSNLETYEVSSDPADKGNGKIYVDADGKAYGPIWGGELLIHA